MEVILLERVAKLGQMGDVVRVKNGYAPQLPAAARQGAPLQRGEPQALRARARRSSRRATSRPARRPRRVAGKLEGQTFVVIRQAGETGQLYGSVSTRDIAETASSRRFLDRAAPGAGSTAPSSRSACTRSDHPPP